MKNHSFSQKLPILGILLFSIYFQNCTHKPTTDVPSDLKLDTLSVTKAKVLWSNYDTHLKVLTKSDSIEYANNAWFSLESLENYLLYAKAKAAKSNQTISGVRVYFGKYDTLTGHENNHFTVFLSPTIKSEHKNAGALMSATGSENDADMNIEVENYGSAGRPPIKVYPYPQ